MDSVVWFSREVRVTVISSDIMILLIDLMFVVCCFRLLQVLVSFVLSLVTVFGDFVAFFRVSLRGSMRFFLKSNPNPRRMGKLLQKA